MPEFDVGLPTMSLEEMQYELEDSSRSVAQYRAKQQWAESEKVTTSGKLSNQMSSLRELAEVGVSKATLLQRGREAGLDRNTAVWSEVVKMASNATQINAEAEATYSRNTGRSAQKISTGALGKYAGTALGTVTQKLAFEYPSSFARVGATGLDITADAKEYVTGNRGFMGDLAEGMHEYSNRNLESARGVSEAARTHGSEWINTYGGMAFDMVAGAKASQAMNLGALSSNPVVSGLLDNFAQGLPFGVNAANDAYYNATKAGLSKSDARRHAGKMAAWEMIPMMIFGAVGKATGKLYLAGSERLATGVAAKGGKEALKLFNTVKAGNAATGAYFKEIAKRFPAMAKDFAGSTAAEMAEESITGWGQMLQAKWDKVDKSGDATLDDWIQTATDSSIGAIAMTALFGGAHRARLIKYKSNINRYINSDQSRADYKALPQEIREVLQKEFSVRSPSADLRQDLAIYLDSYVNPDPDMQALNQEIEDAATLQLANDVNEAVANDPTVPPVQSETIVEPETEVEVEAGIENDADIAVKQWAEARTAKNIEAQVARLATPENGLSEDQARNANQHLQATYTDHTGSKSAGAAKGILANGLDVGEVEVVRDGWNFTFFVGTKDGVKIVQADSRNGANVNKAFGSIAEADKFIAEQAMILKQNLIPAVNKSMAEGGVDIDTAISNSMEQARTDLADHINIYGETLSNIKGRTEADQDGVDFDVTITEAGDNALTNAIMGEKAKAATTESIPDYQAVIAKEQAGSALTFKERAVKDLIENAGWTQELIAKHAHEIIALREDSNLKGYGTKEGFEVAKKEFSKQPGTYAELDIGNLKGVTMHFMAEVAGEKGYDLGKKPADIEAALEEIRAIDPELAKQIEADGRARADKHFAEYARIILEEAGGEGVEFFRKGGDELGVNFANLNQKDAKNILDKAAQKIAEYEKTNNLTEIPHTKTGRSTGFGVIYGISSFEQGQNYEDFIVEADGLVEKIKKGETHEYGGTSIEAGRGEFGRPAESISDSIGQKDKSSEGKPGQASDTGKGLLPDTGKVPEGGDPIVSDPADVVAEGGVGEDGEGEAPVEVVGAKQKGDGSQDKSGDGDGTPSGNGRDSFKSKLTEAFSDYPAEVIEANMLLFDAIGNRVVADGILPDLDTFYNSHLDAGSNLIRKDKDGNLLHENSRACIRFNNKTGKATIFALKNPSISSLTHEFAHFLRKITAQYYPAEIKALEAWAGVKGDKWETKSEEKFARAFELYLRNGKITAENKPIEATLKKFASWVADAYKTIKGSMIDVDLSPEVTKFFDNFVSTIKPTKTTKPVAKVEAKPKPKPVVKKVINKEVLPDKVQSELIKESLKASSFFDKGKLDKEENSAIYMEATVTADAKYDPAKHGDRITYLKSIGKKAVEAANKEETRSKTRKKGILSKKEKADGYTIDKYGNILDAEGFIIKPKMATTEKIVSLDVGIEDNSFAESFESTESASPEKRAIASEQQSILKEAMAKLSDIDQKIVFGLSEGKTQKQIAAELGKKESFISKRKSAIGKEIEKVFGGNIAVKQFMAHTGKSDTGSDQYTTLEDAPMKANIDLLKQQIVNLKAEMDKLRRGKGVRDSKKADVAIRKEFWNIVRSKLPKSLWGNVLRHMRDMRVLNKSKTDDTGMRRLEAGLEYIEDLVQKADKIAATTEFIKLYDKTKKQYGNDYREMLPEHRDAMRALLGSLDPTKLSDKKREQLKGMQDFFDVHPEYKDRLPKHMQDALARLEKTHIGDLSIDEVIAVTNALKQILHEQKTEREFIHNGRLVLQRKAVADAIETVGETDFVDGKKAFIQNNILRRVLNYGENLESVCRMLDGGKDGFFTKFIYGNGVDKSASEDIRIRNRMDKSLESYFKKHKLDRTGIDSFSALLSKTPEKVMTDVGGAKVNLTRGTRIGIALSILDPHGRKAVQNPAGFVVPRIRNGFKKNEPETAIERGMTDEEIETFQKSLTTEEKAMMAVYQDLRNNEYIPTLNKASVIRIGHEIADNPDHYPMKRYSGDIRKSVVNASETPGVVNSTHQTVESYGGLKSRNERANSRMVITDVFAAISEQTTRISAYSAYAMPLRNIRSVLNDPKVIEAIKAKFGGSVLRNMNILIDRVDNRAAKSEPLETYAAIIRGNVAIAKLALNPSTWVAQTLSLPAAAKEIDSKYIAKAVAAMSTKEGRAKAETVTSMDYSPQLSARLTKGHMNRDIGDMMHQAELYTMITGKTKLKQQAGFFLAQFDKITIRTIALASYYEAQATAAKGATKESTLSRAAAIAECVVRRTQPSWDIKDRTRLGGTESEMMKQVTMFRAVPDKFNLMMLDSIRRFKGSAKSLKDKKDLAATALLWTLVLPGEEVIRALLTRWLKGYDDGEEDLKGLFGKKLVAAKKRNADIDSIPTKIIKKQLGQLPFVGNIIYASDSKFKESLTSAPAAEASATLAYGLFQAYDYFAKERAQGLHGKAKARAEKKAHKDLKDVIHNISSGSLELFGVPTLPVELSKGIDRWEKKNDKKK